MARSFLSPRAFFATFLFFAGVLFPDSIRAAGGKWEKLEGCRFIEGRGNDGDSFHVSHNGRAYIFRLCYVDTPEDEFFHWLKKRLTEQQEYWKISREELFRISREATKFTARELSGKFTVWTDWHDAKGNSSEPRYFAVVQSPSGDLAELLGARGLARVHGYMPAHPHGKSGPAVMRRLREVEKTAFRKKLGAWKNSKRQAPPVRAPQIN